jgi:hypothetical protein
VSAAENLSQEAVFDPQGRRIACAACGKRLKHPHEGRPRVICATRACALAYRRLRKADQRERRVAWRLEDFEEALRVWELRCAFCERKSLDLEPSRYHLAPLPACQRCANDARAQLIAGAEAQERIARYLERAAPGAPLPSPYLGAGSESSRSKARTANAEIVSRRSTHRSLTL